MGWIDEQGNPVTDPGRIQQLELAYQGQGQQGVPQGPPQKTLFGQTVAPGTVTQYQPNPTEGILGGAGLLGLPAAIREVPSLMRGIGSALTAPWTRRGRVAQVAQGLGREVNPAIRLAEARQPITEAYKVAENIDAGVPVGGIKSAIRRAISETPMDEKAVDELLKLESSDLAGNAPGGIAQYKDLVRAEQNLPTDLYDNTTNAAMRNVRQSIVDATKAVHPALANANALTAHTMASDKVLRLVTSSKDAPSALAQIDNLFTKDPFAVKALGFNNPAAMEQFRSLVGRGAGPDIIKAFLGRMAAIAPWAALHMMTRGSYGGGGYGG